MVSLKRDGFEFRGEPAEEYRASDQGDEGNPFQRFSTLTIANPEKERNDGKCYDPDRRENPFIKESQP